jgi:hypothetical protein
MSVDTDPGPVEVPVLAGAIVAKHHRATNGKRGILLECEKSIAGYESLA